MEEEKQEDMVAKHLRVVNEVAEILNREFKDHDDIYFLIRTLRNIFLWDEEENKIQHYFSNSLNRFARFSENREWMKRTFNFKDK